MNVLTCTLHIGQAAERFREIVSGIFRYLLLYRLIGRICPSEPQQSFLRVAHELFSDGICNWGRVVALFYFGFKLAVRVCEWIILINRVNIKKLWSFMLFANFFILE